MPFRQRFYTGRLAILHSSQLAIHDDLCGMLQFRSTNVHEGAGTPTTSWRDPANGILLQVQI